MRTPKHSRALEQIVGTQAQQATILLIPGHRMHRVAEDDLKGSARNLAAPVAGVR
jgi:hypothetical protein